MAETFFHHMPRTVPEPQQNKSLVPEFTPGNFLIQDDQMQQANIGVFYNAPSWLHEDFYGFLVL
jgi:hypothetical protein